ncbi:MAG: DUF6259 domain-containing protein [bacterium]|nr:DUF6259 domain-containing protein [bacterium]
MRGSSLFALCCAVPVCLCAMMRDLAAASEPSAASEPGVAPAGAVRLENEQFSLEVDRASGALRSLVVKPLGTDLIGEKRLLANFRICLPLKDYLANYIDGMAQMPVSVEQAGDTVTVRFSEMKSDKGTFGIDLEYTITLASDEVRFHAKLTNRDANAISEFWFPRIGGWTRYDKDRDAVMSIPEYRGCGKAVFFRHFPGGRGLGAEAAEFVRSYPGMAMPWVDLHDSKSDLGLYLGYHDTTFRLSTWHAYLMPNTSGLADSFLTPEQAAGQPVGVVFSHVRYPYIKGGETFDTGDFILRLHKGDWHQGSQYYRDWFMKHFPFDKSKSWLRRQTAWFTSIIYQPEDKIITDYKGYAQWTRDAQKYGINTFELIGWDKGGIERDYPQYVPAEILGGRPAWRAMIKEINDQGGHLLAFANYNILDSCSDYYPQVKQYTHMDQFGKTPNWMAWGESTLTARMSVSVRRHVLSSVTPEIEAILNQHFTDIARDGAAGLQIDKVVASSALDFNPRNTLKPDVALYEGLVRAIGNSLAECRKINPDFCFASEFSQDRLLPYVDVGYRNVGGDKMSPLRVVFPEWTACQHVASPRDFDGVNGAVLTGAVICVEPGSYQESLASPLYKDLAEYIKEVTRIREELKDVIFLGNYYDDQGAQVTPVGADGRPGPGALSFRVHGRRDIDRRAIAVANYGDEENRFQWKFTDRDVPEVELRAPFEPERRVKAGEPVAIKPHGVVILLQPE